MTAVDILRRLLRGDVTSDRVVPATGFTAALTVISAAAMAVLAVFTIALAQASAELAARWEAELEGTATVRILASAEEVEAQTEAVLMALSQTPGIGAARRVQREEQLALLAPWFGNDLPLETLRLPVLIEVSEAGEGPDVSGLNQRLAAEAPGAVYDSHGRWRAPLIEAAGRLRQLGLTALFLIAAVTGAIIALGASAALAANAQIVDVLRLVGARDGWITRAFVRRFTLRAGLGALAGTLVAMVAVALIPGGVETGILSGLGFDGTEWLWPLVVPLAAAGIASVATYLAAARRLRQAT